MKKAIILTAAVVGLAVGASAQTVSFTGTALVSQSSASNPLNLAAGQVGVFINNDNLSLWSGFNGPEKIGSGLSLTSSATYTPIGTSDSFTFLGSNTVSGTTNFSLSGGIPSIALTGGVSTTDQYSVVVFNLSTTVTLPGDTYRIFRASDWLIPAGGSSIGYSTTPSAAAYQQIRTTGFEIATGTVVPEPSTYALLSLAGIALGGYAVRRRRRKA
jgi:hypothetical protein